MIDRYTKFILTMIAIGLFILTAVLILQSDMETIAQARPQQLESAEIIDVQIVAIQRKGEWESVPVNIK